MTEAAAPLARWAAAVAASDGRARWGWAFLGGVLAALALPPLGAFPLIWPGFILLVLLLQGAPDRARPVSPGTALATGWFFGFGFFVVGLYWLGLPVVVDIVDEGFKDLVLAGGIGGTALVGLGLGLLLQRRFGMPASAWRRPALHAAGWLIAFVLWAAVAMLFIESRFAWMVPLAVFAFSAGLAVFPALAGWVLGVLRLRGAALILALPVAWVALEWLRGHILTGFPWNLMATAWSDFSAMLQPAALVGAYGLSYLTVLIACLPALFFIGRSPRGRSAGLASAALVLGVMAAAGALRLPDAATATVDGVRLRLVQPSIPQRLKWRDGAAAANIERHIALSRGAAAAGITHIIWPETASAFFLTTNATNADYRRRVAAFRRRLAALVPPGGALITGAVRADHRLNQVYNSVQVLTADGAVRASYDKHHLVPFGEYVPARGLLGALGIERLAQGQGDFGAGDGPQILNVEGLPGFSPLVCYEAIFPGEAVPRDARPNWLLNVTNDAWFGASSGPYQHFASARLRAVEQGLPLVRVANTGISAVVDPYGRVRRRLGLNETGVIDAALPTALTPTLYARYGDWLLLLLLTIGTGISIFAARLK